MFEALDIPTNYVKDCLAAFNTHSQNNLLFDPNTAGNISEDTLVECDKVLNWVGIPFDTKSSLADFKMHM